MSTIQIERYPALGAEILGVDTVRLLEDDDLPALVLDALEDNGVVVFRDLHLDDETQVAFCRRLGDIVELPGSELPGIFRVSLDPDISPMAAYLRGTFDWHIDGATVKEAPVKATVLTAHAVAEVGGETEFASTYAAYDNLTARSTAPDRVYRHEWSVGDTVIWDNRGVLHRALPYADKSPRDMHRTTLVGDETIA